MDGVVSRRSVGGVTKKLHVQLPVRVADRQVASLRPAQAPKSDWPRREGRRRTPAQHDPRLLRSYLRRQRRFRTHVALWSFGIGTAWVVWAYTAGSRATILWPAVLTAAWSVIVLLHGWTRLVERTAIESSERDPRRQQDGDLRGNSR
jgi:hypothetical protein